MREYFGPEFRQLIQGCTRLGVEADFLTFMQIENVRRQVDPETVIEPADSVISSLRAVKGPDEILQIERACQVAHQALRAFLESAPARETEAEAAGRLEYECRRMGGEASPFPTIVLTGPRSSLPHGQPGSRQIDWSAPLLIDFGFRLGGYCSDLTRTLIPAARRDAERIASIVRDAQHAAISAVRPGVAVQEVDRAARMVIEEAGYGDFFGHGTGHGIGLDVHEPPRISPLGGGELVAGMVFTVEPGIYLPEQFGVRIEDVVVVTGNGRRVLS